jgi:hypothetical protein
MRYLLFAQKRPGLLRRKLTPEKVLLFGIAADRRHPAHIDVKIPGSQ